MPLPTSLVVKNGSKILSITSGGMPVPVSATSISDDVARRHAGQAEAARLLGRDVAGADRELAAVRHGVARVDGEVHDHLLELVHVGLDEPEVAPVLEVELDALAEEAPQQHRQVRQDLAEVEDLGPQRLAAREREQLAHEARRPVGVLLDLHDVLEGRIGRAVVGQQEVRVADDGLQHVVEVVRDPARELPDRLHLLRLGELLLELALLGGVERVEDRALAVRVRRRSPG